MECVAGERGCGRAERRGCARVQVHLGGGRRPAAAPRARARGAQRSVASEPPWLPSRARPAVRRRAAPTATGGADARARRLRAPFASTRSLA